MNRPDYDHMENLIVQAMVNICRDDNANREVDITKMIHFTGDMHLQAIMTLVGAVLISTKLTDDSKKIEEMLKCAKGLIEAQDANFSMQLRSSVLKFVTEHKTFNPFAPFKLQTKPLDSQ